MRALILILSLFVSFSALNAEGIVKGYVLDLEDATLPVVDATVSSSYGQTQTNSEGYFEINWPDSGTLNQAILVIEKDGYMTTEVCILNISEYRILIPRNPETFQLEPKRGTDILKGYVFEETEILQIPVDGVTLTNEIGESTITNSEGFFEINWPCMDYTCSLYLEKDGYTSIEVNIENWVEKTSIMIEKYSDTKTVQESGCNWYYEDPHNPSQWFEVVLENGALQKNKNLSFGNNKNLCGSHIGRTTYGLKEPHVKIASRSFSIFSDDPKSHIQINNLPGNKISLSANPECNPYIEYKAMYYDYNSHMYVDDPEVIVEFNMDRWCFEMKNFTHLSDWIFQGKHGENQNLFTSPIPQGVSTSTYVKGFELDKWLKNNGKPEGVNGMLNGNGIPPVIGPLPYIGPSGTVINAYPIDCGVGYTITVSFSSTSSSSSFMSNEITIKVESSVPGLSASSATTTASGHSSTKGSTSGNSFTWNIPHNHPNQMNLEFYNWFEMMESQLRDDEGNVLKEGFSARLWTAVPNFNMIEPCDETVEPSMPQEPLQPVAPEVKAAETRAAPDKNVEDEPPEEPEEPEAPKKKGGDTGKKGEPPHEVVDEE